MHSYHNWTSIFFQSFTAYIFFLNANIGLSSSAVNVCSPARHRFLWNCRAVWKKMVSLFLFLSKKICNTLSNRCSRVKCIVLSCHILNVSSCGRRWSMTALCSFLIVIHPRMDSFVQIWAEGSREPWRNPHYCYFKWLQETRAPTHVMGFPLHVPQQQDVLNMGICLLTSTPLFFFPSWGSNTLGGWVRLELRDC